MKMADFQNWISNYLIEPLRKGLFNKRTRFASQSTEDSSGLLRLTSNTSLSEIHTPQTEPEHTSEDPFYNLIRDSAKYIHLNFGVTFNCMGVSKKNFLEHYHVHAADIEQQKSEIIPKTSIGHSQLSKFLLFFMHPFQILPEENKLSFPSLSRSFPDCKRDRNTFMMSVCGSKFTQMGRLCFASNITPITNIEIGLKTDELEVGEIAEEYFAKSVPSTSAQDSCMQISNNSYEDVKSHTNVQEPARKSSKLEVANATLDDGVLIRDRQRKQARKRKNRRRKQNRKIREESSSSNGSSVSSNHDSDTESVKTNEESNLHENGLMEIDNDCDDMVIFMGEDENSKMNTARPNSIADQLLLFGFEEASTLSEDDLDSEDEEDGHHNFSDNNEDYESLFFSSGLALSNLVSSNPRSASEIATNSASQAINITPRSPTSPTYVISPSPDMSSFLTEDDIRRNMIMMQNDMLADSAVEANERWKEEYTEECSTCDQAIQNSGDDKAVIKCPAKRTLVKFSDDPKVIVYKIPEEEKQFLAELEHEVEEFLKTSPVCRDRMNFDDEDE